MAISKELLKGTTTLLILQLVKEEDKYGYEMTTALEQSSEPISTRQEGTLYPILHSLENDGRIEAYYFFFLHLFHLSFQYNTIPQTRWNSYSAKFTIASLKFLLCCGKLFYIHYPAKYLRNGSCKF